MIIIIDGLNGTGKTTITRWLSQHYQLPLCRVFRRPDNEADQVHWEAGGGKLTQGSGVSFETDLLRRAGVPFNTFVDDMYTADIAAKLKIPGMVLDRSMPSSYAYGMMATEHPWTDWNLGLEVWNHWQRMLASVGCPVIYFLFRAHYRDVKSRCENRSIPKQSDFWELDAHFLRTVRMFTIGRVEVTPPNVGLDFLERWTEYHCNGLIGRESSRL